MIDRRSRPLMIMALGCFGWLSLSFMPAFADDTSTPETQANSGWPSMPLPNPGDVSDLFKTASTEKGDASETSDTDSATGNEVKESASNQSDNSQPNSTSSITSDVMSIPDPTSHADALQQMRTPAVIQTQSTLNGSKEQSQSTTDNNSK